MKGLCFLLSGLVLISCSESTRFRLVDPEKTGIDFQNTVTESDTLNILNYEYLYNGAGVGAGDLNNDGLIDLVFAGNQVSPEIYLNLGDFRFKKITMNFDSISNGQWYSGVAIGDVNNDGWLDVYLTSTANRARKKCKNRLWINGGSQHGEDPHFTEESEKYGLDCEDQSVAAAFLDYDLDGYPDLYVLNNEYNSIASSAYRQKIVDGTSPNNDRLFHNNADGTFSDVTKEAGIVIEGFGMGLAISDINMDGYPDIYVSNDLLANDVLYINQGNGTFRNEISDYLSYQSRSSKGNDIADVNNDGLPDIFTLDMMPADYFRQKQTINGFNYLYYAGDREFGFEHQYQRNMLHLNNGYLNGKLLPFSEAGQIAGIYETDWSWSSVFADYDNDGDKDLIVTNGFPRDIRDKDWTKIKASAEGSLTSEKALSAMAPSLKLPNVTFENTGDTVFRIRKNWFPDIPSFSYGAVSADLDNDGDLDYVVNNINDKAFIYKNSTIEKSKGHSHYIRIKLKGSRGNTLAIGSKVEIWAGGKLQYSEHFLTRGYASTVDPVVHFGLGTTSVIDSAKVTWPQNSRVTLLKNIKADQTVEIDEKEFTGCESFQIPGRRENLFFTENDSILDYSHEEDDFNDFALPQKIIPHKFSQTGPCMVSGDINGDGKEDIITGSTNEQPTMVFLRKGAGFQKTEFEGLTTKKNFTESDMAVLDYDNDDDNDIVIVAGGYENNDESDYKHYIYENMNGVFIQHPLNIPQFPASVIRPCDFDNDGDIDLFIGSRVKKGIFPYANHSWLLINNGGTFSAISDFRLNLGMVTDAVWTDFDNDGFKDLLIARDWNSVVLMRNENGQRLVPQNIPKLEEMHGLWYSVTAADLDGDGDDDYIAGNLGENNRFPVSLKYPLRLYAIDLEPDGIFDPLITAYYNDRDGTMTEYPVNYLDELWSQSRFMEARCKDYTSFSYLSFNELIPEPVMKRLAFSLFVNTTASYIIWNDAGAFRWEKLPWRLQLSPISKVITCDLNGDSLTDVVAAGNDYSWALSSGYFDANKGMILINRGADQNNKGKHKFDVLGPSESGLLLDGMIGSLLLLKGDTSLLVAGKNRSEAVVYELKHKPSGSKGIFHNKNFHLSSKIKK